MNKQWRAVTLSACALLFSGAGQAQTINLQQAIDMSMNADPRIQEREQLVEQARAMLEEAQGNNGLRLEANLFVGLAPKVEGGFYQGGATAGGTPRNDAYDWKGLSDWTSLQFSIVKPLYTFGKIGHYVDAAKGNIDVKSQDVRLQRGDTMLDVSRAYYAYLTARDTRRMLDDVRSKVNNTVARVEKWLEADNGQATQSDLYELQAKRALLNKYFSQAQAVETVSLNGLKTLTGIGLEGSLEVVDEGLKPVPLPGTSLADLQGKAITGRPEMAQLEAGLGARRALVGAKKAEMYPNIYAGVVGSFAYASRRDRLDNPYVYDPFNHAGLTPVVGVKWDLAFDVVPARVAQAQAELEALLAKNRFALAGIPFEVAEAYTQMQAYHAAQLELATGAAAARRWMVASYADFSAGLEKPERVAEALRTYATTQAEYLLTVNEYNMHVARLAKVTGDYK
ncbi:MAG: TolC family protein [Sulfuricella denitrificans]|nr:TolC family protein [Sulfuricella denitrificans]